MDKKETTDTVFEKGMDFKSEKAQQASADLEIVDGSGLTIQTLERPFEDVALSLTEATSEWKFHLVNSQTSNLEDLSIDVKTLYDEIAKHEEEKRALKQSLEAYIESLKTRETDGDRMVVFPSDYTRLIDQLFLQNRTDYHCLEDWSGPRNYIDFRPIAEHSYKEDSNKRTGLENEISQGLNSIKELDGELKTKEVESYLIERETFPAKFKTKEQRRLKKKQIAFEQALKTQRQRICDISKLKRALEESFSEDGSTAASSSGLDPTTYSFIRTLQLSPEEETQILRVLNESDEDLLMNPFDCDVFLEEDLPSDSLLTSSKNTSSEYSCPCKDTGRRKENTEVASSKRSSLYQSLRPDYLHEVRLEKERNQRLREIDKELQDLKTEDLCSLHVSKKDIQALILATKNELSKLELIEQIEII